MFGIRAPRRVVLAGVLLLWVASLPALPRSRADDAAGSSDAARTAYASAAALQNREAWDLAAEEWEALVKAHPQDPLALKGRYYLGICQLRNDQTDKAAATFRTVIDSKADAATVALARWELGRGGYRAAQARPSPEAYATAARDLAAFVAQSPGHPQLPDALSILGEALWQAGKRPDAIAAWQRCVRDHPQSPGLPEVLYSLGVAQAETGSGAEAAATLKRFAEAYPKHPLADDVALWRADLATAAGKPAEAEQLLAGVIDRKGGRTADALERLAMARWNRKDWIAAAQGFAAIAEGFPGSPRAATAAFSAGMAYAKAGKRDEARAWLGRVAAAPTTDAAQAAAAAEAAERLAGIEIDSGRPAEAAKVAEQAIARLAGMQATADTKRLAARLSLARADALWEIPDQRAQAAAAYAAIVQQHPDEPAARTALSMTALASLQLGKPAEALAQADRFLKQHAAKDPADPLVSDVRAIRAEALLATGDAAAAATAYQELIAAAPAAPATAPARLARWRLRHGVALVTAKQWQPAHETLAAAATALEGDAAAETLLLDATALVELKQPAAAAQALAKAERVAPTWQRRDEALLLLIRAQREAGDKPASLATAERLVKEFPAGANADVAWYRLGQARQDAGKYDEAIQAFGTSRELKPQGSRAPWCLLATGWCHEAKGRPAEATRAWTALIDTHPESPATPPALLARADARQRQGDYQGGLADARAVLTRRTAGAKLDADAGPEALLIEGLCLSGLKQYPEAAAAFKKLLDERPDGAAADRAMFELGAAESLAGRAADAAATFTTLVKRFPKSPYAADAAFELGEQAWTAGRFAEAEQAYRSVIEAVDRGGGTAALGEQARHKLAWTFVSRQDHAAAAKAFAEQVSKHPDGPLAADAQAMRGEELFQDGSLAEASAAFRQALADPKRLPSESLRGLAFVRAAECAAALEQWAESLAIADRFVAAEPGSPQAPQARYAAAWAKQNLGRLDEALAAYRSLADAGRTELAARARLMEGEVLFEQGQHKEAIKAFFKAAYGFGERQAPPAFHPWQAQATFEAARCFEVLAQQDKAGKLYTELVDRYPDSQQAPAARKRLDALGGQPR